MNKKEVYKWLSKRGIKVRKSFKALSGELGMPVNYYLKPLSKSYIAKLWVNKYFPNKFLKVVDPEQA